MRVELRVTDHVCASLHSQGMSEVWTAFVQELEAVEVLKDKQREFEVTFATRDGRGIMAFLTQVFVSSSQSAPDLLFVASGPHSLLIGTLVPGLALMGFVGHRQSWNSTKRRCTAFQWPTSMFWMCSS